MAGRKRGDLDRREFLTRSGLVIAGGGCFGTVAALRSALAVAQAQGKPLLTEHNANALIQGVRSSRTPGSVEMLRAQARANVRGFVRDHFALTPDQEKKLNALTPLQIAQLNEALDNGLSGRNELRVRMTVAGPSRIGPRPGQPSGTVNDFRIGIEHKVTLVGPEISGHGAGSNPPNGATTTSSWTIVWEC